VTQCWSSTGDPSLDSSAGQIAVQLAALTEGLACYVPIDVYSPAEARELLDAELADVLG
jgi:hypothetical protein